MNKITKSTLHAKGLDIGIYSTDFENEFISLTDIARFKSADPFITVCNWLRKRNTLEFLGLWEKLHNPNFKPIEFDRFKEEAGTNAFTMSPERWTRNTCAAGIVVKRGRYGGGTYAHTDIAMAFATWISPELQLYVMKDYRRLKLEETSKQRLDWNLKREISKLNYDIHTDAIKERLLPFELKPEQLNRIYSEEADVLNVALFGQTASEWKKNNKDKEGNIRDYATVEQLLVLANLESYNATLINQGILQSKRLVLLREMANKQLKSILRSLDSKPKGLLP